MATWRAFASLANCVTSLWNKVSGGPSIDSNATVRRPDGPMLVAPSTGWSTVVQAAVARPPPAIASVVHAALRAARPTAAPRREVQRNIADPCPTGRSVLWVSSTGTCRALMQGYSEIAPRSRDSTFVCVIGSSAPGSSVDHLLERRVQDSDHLV